MIKLQPTLAVLCAAAITTAEAQDAPTPERMVLAAMHGEYLETLRETGMANPGKIAEFFTDTAKSEWTLNIAPEFFDPLVADFFTAALMLVGPHDHEGGVFGFYNPWWDAILMLQTKGSLPKEEADKMAMPLVTRLAFVSGESFRGEKAEGAPTFETVVPGDDPISVSIWRVQDATVKKFDSLYPDVEDTSFRAREFGARDNKAEFDRIQARAGLRLKFAHLLVQEPEQIAIADRIGEVLREATVSKVKEHFASPVHEFFAETLCELQPALRAGFDLYGYVPAGAGTLFIFVNKDVPRIYATVSFPAGRVQDPEKGNVIFEWYDLARADELLEVWKTEKQ